VIRTPVRAPRAKAQAERWVGSPRRECLDRILILGRRHLEQVVRAYISHHNEHRPHRSLEQRPRSGGRREPRHRCRAASGAATDSAACSTNTTPSPRKRGG
jgi:putative transposase